MKKTYETLDMEIIRFRSMDVITTSDLEDDELPEVPAHPINTPNP